MYTYQNPVIRGFNPDPSICRVGEDYYLVVSSFEFFPGVPIYHSKNLVDWELISYCLTRDSQLNLVNCKNSGGIFAPTIRYHKGTFYMTTTNVSGKGNFIVHTNDIRGKWSDPVWIDQGGIDPSLFFTEDGKVLFCSTTRIDGKIGIGLCEVNPKTGEQLTKTVLIHQGSGGKFPEAPHIYFKDGWYYLMMAEGGTEYGHMETIFRSRQPYGPYESCPFNPILSHKDYMGSPIQATGHADLVEDTNGQWWCVCLGIRPLNHSLLHNLGRETFLAPVHWDSEGWPVVGKNGSLALCMEGNLPSAPSNNRDISFCDTFVGDTLHPEWNHVRNPIRERYLILDGEQKGLRLKAGPETLNDYQPTYIGVRQREFHVIAKSQVLSTLKGENPKAGIVAYYNSCYHYEIYITKRADQHFVELGKSVHDIVTVTHSQAIAYNGSIQFQIEADKENYRFFYSLSGDPWTFLGSGATAGLCTEGTMHMTFTGTYLGLFCSDTQADFLYFSITEDTRR